MDVRVGADPAGETGFSGYMTGSEAVGNLRPCGDFGEPADMGE